MTHSHNKNWNAGNALKIGIIVNIVYMTVEAFFGVLSNSTALLADAGHNFSDVLALGFSWFAIRLSSRRPTLKYTYGLRRSTILVAMLNTLILMSALLFIFWETVERLRNPLEINAKSVIIVAAIGIIVNGFTAWLFARGEKQDLNIRSAFLHFLSDGLVSLGIVTGGIVITLTGFYLIDALVSFIIIAVILVNCYHLLSDSVHLALDAVPDHINIEAIRNYLEAIPEVFDIHDLHIWALSTTDSAMTVHIKTKVQTDTGFVLAIQNHLRDQFQIEHTTIQVEFGDLGPCNTNC